MNLIISNLEKVIFYGFVNKVTLPGALCKFQILENHAPILSSLISGDIVYFINDKKYFLKIDSGMVDVKQNTVKVFLF